LQGGAPGPAYPGNMDGEVEQVPADRLGGGVRATRALPPLPGRDVLRKAIITALARSASGGRGGDPGDVFAQQLARWDRLSVEALTTGQVSSGDSGPY
jgi:hypothetical protein